MEKKANAIKDVPYTPEHHFILNFYAALFHVLDHMHRMGELKGTTGAFTKFPFLEKYLLEIMKFVPEDTNWEEGLVFFEKELEKGEKSSPENLPILSLAKKNGLDYKSRMGMMIIGLVEEDSRFGTLMAGLQKPLGHRRVCLETVEQIMSGGNVCNTLFRANVIEVMNPDEPRSEWVLRVSPVLWEVMRGNLHTEPAPWCRYHPQAGFPGINALKYDDGFKLKLGNVPSLFRDGYADALILRGMQGEPRLAVAGSIARCMDMGVIEITDLSHMTQKNWDILGSLCVMMRAMPVITLDAGPGETIELPDMKGTFCVIIMGNEGGIKGMKRSVTLNLPLPDASYRRRCWMDAISGFPVEDLETIVNRFHMPGDHIRRVFDIAKANAVLSGKSSIKPEDIREASSTFNRQILDNLAVRIESDDSWDKLIVSEGTKSRLRELEIRCVSRDKINEGQNSHRKNPGVRAIFTGMSGTGKTMAAKILAASLGMDIYRVDLAALVNKYIGETEKNLHRILSRAEELDVILLLDESDALLGSRTEIRSANDRYANLETDYLLQRLENYRGILVMTTNTPENIDSAFQRRMDVVVDFIPPQASERSCIWRLHLNEKNDITHGYLEEIAQRCAMTGGQIKNAAFYANLLALNDGGIVTTDHLVRAIESEYRKAGSSSPLKMIKNPGAKGVESFLELL